MQIGLVSGSTRLTGTTQRVLRKLAERWSQLVPAGLTFADVPDLGELPLFTPERLAAGRPAEVEAWATFVKTSDALVVATPEYAHNLPAVLKSAFEWLVASGEFSRKRVLALTVTPAPPRGERCMQSLVWTLTALDAQVLAEVPLYVSSAAIDAPEPGAEWLTLLEASAELLL